MVAFQRTGPGQQFRQLLLQLQRNLYFEIAGNAVPAHLQPRQMGPGNIVMVTQTSEQLRETACFLRGQLDYLEMLLEKYFGGLEK